MRPITIIGGGLAGLTLGIALRREETPVTIVEAGSYPRHRVCGEFISGAGLAALSRLGLMELTQPHAIWAKTLSCSKRGGYLSAELPQSALCISRFVLDKLLVDEYLRLGGELRTGERWTETFDRPGVVRTTGRRLNRSIEGTRLYGLKAHVKGLELRTDLEMHFSARGYVGLCRLPEREVNICGLFQAKTSIPTKKGDWLAFWRDQTSGAVSDGLANAELDEDSICSVAGITLKPFAGESEGETALGDALTMIPPVTGNGMSMAFESAELAIELISGYAKERIGWEETAGRLKRKLREHFHRRLRWASLLQTVLFIKSGQDMLFFGTKVWPGFIKFAFRQTR